MGIRIFTVPVTTSGGSALVYSEVIKGYVAYVRYRKVDFPDGVDFAIVGKDTLQGIWTEADVNLDTIRYPRAAAHGVDGVAIGGGYSPIVLDEAVKITVVSGGSAKTGSFEIGVVD